MKKLLCAFLVVMLFAGLACAESIKVGLLSKLNVSQEEFNKFVKEQRDSGKSSLFSAGGEAEKSYVYYDSLMSLIMAVNAGEVNEILLPEDVAEYVLNINDSYKVSRILRGPQMYLSFGFRKDDDPALRRKFNEALMSMQADGTLAILQAKYIDEPGIGEPASVEFGRYENEKETVRVAVTGDMPPIDYVNTAGTPAGFNTAVLAEIAKLLKINIELVNIDSGARAAALASGRVDLVFWFEAVTGESVQVDIPESITLSEPYYYWNEFLFLSKK